MNTEIKLALVGLIWGISNPFIRRGSSGMDKIIKNSYLQQIIAEISFLIFNWRYMIPFVLANIGSVLYYFTLQEADLTFAVPFANSLTFLFTAVTGWFLGEQKPDMITLLGMMLIVSGVYCYVLHSI